MPSKIPIHHPKFKIHHPNSKYTNPNTKYHSCHLKYKYTKIMMKAACHRRMKARTRLLSNGLPPVIAYVCLCASLFVFVFYL